MNIEEVVALEKQLVNFLCEQQEEKIFLAVCRSCDKNVDLDKMSSEVPLLN